MKIVIAIVSIIAFATNSHGQAIDTIRMQSSSKNLIETSDLKKIIDLLKKENELVDCGFQMQGGGIKTILNAFNKDLNTTVFDEIEFITSTRFSLSSDNNKCITIQEWYFKDEKTASKAMSLLKIIPKSTIHYKPPQNWLWQKVGRKIFFIYSETFSTNSDTVKKIKKQIESIRL